MICKKNTDKHHDFNPPPATPSLYSIQTDDELASTRVIEFSIFFIQMALIHFDTQCRMSSSKKTSMEAKRPSSKIIHNNNSPFLHFRKDKHQNQEKPIFAPSMDADCLRVHIINSKLTTLPWGKLYVLCQLSAKNLRNFCKIVLLVEVLTSCKNSSELFAQDSYC